MKTTKGKYKIGDLIMMSGHNSIFIGIILDKFLISKKSSIVKYKIFWENQLILDYDEHHIVKL